MADCEHGKLYYLDYANQPKAFGSCPLCDRDSQRASINSQTEEILQLRGKLSSALERLDIRQDADGGQHDAIDRLTAALHNAEFEVDRGLEHLANVMDWADHRGSWGSEGHLKAAAEFLAANYPPVVEKPETIPPAITGFKSSGSE